MKTKIKEKKGEDCGFNTCYGCILWKFCYKDEIDADDYEYKPRKKYIKNILLILLCVLFVSCNPIKRAERKIERLAERYPTLLQKDTIRDTIIKPALSYDTILSHKEIKDTVIIEKDGVVVTIYETKTDSIYLNVYQPADTIIKNIPIDKIIIKEKDNNKDKITIKDWIKYIFYFIIFIIILRILYFFRII